MTFILRDYQKKASDAGVGFFMQKKTKKNGLIVIPTGGGKSLVIADISNRLNAPVIVFQPSKELLEQNYNKYLSYGNSAEIYSASMNQKTIGNVTFATIGSVYKDAEIFKGFQHAIIDECHLFNPESDSMYNRFFNVNHHIKIVGLTATPIRLKQYNFPAPHSKLCMLNRMRPCAFHQYIHVTQIQELVERGYFAKTKYASVKFDRSRLVPNTKGSDFTDKSIRDVLSIDDMNNRVAQYVKLAIQKGRKHILVFTDSVDNAMDISELTNGGYVHGGTNKKERGILLDKFRSGEIRVMANVGVLTTGFDFPALDTIILARPTMSLALYYQMIGRGVRPFETKSHCAILDLVGNYETFGRVEDLVIKETKGGWAIINVAKNRLLTNVEMTENVQPPPDEGTINFGKHKGKKFSQIPIEYLYWVVENMEKTKYNKDLFDYVGSLTK